MAGTNLYTGLNGNGTISVALTDENGYATLAKCTGAPPTTADTFQHGCLMTRTDTATGSNALYQNTGSVASPAWTLIDTALPGDTASSLVDTNGLTVIDTGATASAVNNLRVTNSATGAVAANAVAIAPVGTDAAISLLITPKAATGILTLGLSTGTGDIVVGSSSGAQAVKIGNGAGVTTVNLANVTTAGATINIAGGATLTGVTDSINIGCGSPAGTGIKTIAIGNGTPATSGNMRILLGGGTTSVLTLNAITSAIRVMNYIASETGANNAIAGALLDANGSAVPLAAGLEVTVKLGHTLQIGANTFNLNAGGAVAIKKHTAAATDLSVAYAATGIIKLIYDGSVWLDLSQ